jgi:DNA-binding FrmR family transcriptional regulator
LVDESKAREDVLSRLRRIEGQVRGIARMVEEGKYCVDVLVQVAAAKAALNSVGLQILENHTRGCVTKAVKDGRETEAIQELVDVIGKFVR